MRILKTDAEVDLILANQAQAQAQAAREAVAQAVREAGGKAGIFTVDELKSLGIVPGKKFVLKGSKSGPIAVVRTLDDGTVFVAIR